MVNMSYIILILLVLIILLLILILKKKKDTFQANINCEKINIFSDNLEYCKKKCDDDKNNSLDYCDIFDLLILK